MALLEQPEVTEVERRKAINRMALFMSRITMMLFVLTLVSLTSPFWWGAEIFANFAWHYMIISVVLAAILIRFKRIFFVLIALLTFVTNLYLVLPLYEGSTEIAVMQHESHGSELRVLQYNLLARNTKKELLVDWLLDQSYDNDIIVLQEVSDQWQRALRPVMQRYNNVVETAMVSGDNVVVLANMPLESSNVIKLAGRQVIKLKAYTPDLLIPFTLYALHANSPLGAVEIQSRNDLLLSLAHYIIKQGDESLIIVGDFNATPFSPVFKKMLALGRFKNSGAGVGYMGTWPSVLPPELAIPIDHLLMSENIKTVKKDIYRKRLGSDHYPVLTTLSIKRP